MNVSVIIPVYRANKEMLVELISRVNSLRLLDYEVLLVYDQGTNEAYEAVVFCASNFKRVRSIILSKNFGQHNAIICGIEFAKGDYIITMDEDLQHDPNDIPKLINHQIESKSEVVYGKYHELNHSAFRNFTSLILKKLLKLGIPSLHPNFTSFRLISGSVAKKLIGMKNSYTFLDGYLSWVTSSVTSVYITHSKSASHKSSYTLRKLIEHSINIFVTFSHLPIRILTLSATMFISLSFSYSIFIVVTSLKDSDYETGFPTFIAFLGFGFGLVLFGLGVIGEYIARINYKTTNRPNYIVKELL